MKRIFTTITILCIASTALAAGQRRRTVQPVVSAALTGAWTIEVTSSGGITGGGGGGVTISADGTVGILLIGDRAPRCTFKLDSAALASIDRLVAQTVPSDWVASYVPADTAALCCDQITTKLKLSRKHQPYDEVYITEWLRPNAVMPFDLKQLIEAVTDGPSSIRNRFTPLCH